MPYSSTRSVYISLVQKNLGPLLLSDAVLLKDFYFISLCWRNERGIELILGIVVAVPACKAVELAGDISFFYWSGRKELFTIKAKTPTNRYL